MRHAAQVIVARLQLSGFCGLDFVLASKDETAYLIEMNPRCTQLGHLKMAGGISLASKFAAALRGDFNQTMQTLLGPERIAFFPQASASGPICKPYIEASYHDLPHGAPELTQELMNAPWPQRQLLSKLYHTLKPVEPAEPALYEEVTRGKIATERRLSALGSGGL
jgi:hypothetical protein